MKISSLILVFFFTGLLAFAQDDLYAPFKSKTHTTDTSGISIEKSIEYNLFKYYKERQTAWIVSFTGIALAGGAGLMAEQRPDLSGKVLIAAAATEVIASIIFYDSEKWLKRASFNISPGKLTINF